jgi:F-type H+-transporting ATPase subunit a
LTGQTTAADDLPAAPDETPAPRRRRVPTFLKVLLVVAAVIAFDILAGILVPPYPKEGQAGEACSYPACFIDGNVEVPAPDVVWGPPLDPEKSINFQMSISSTIVTSWIVMALILVVFFVGTRRLRLRPGRLQNVVEFAYEGLANFADSVGGAATKPYVPVFAGFFLFILFSNWSGLVPPIGKVEFLRAPTSDLNITLGLALTSFIFFEAQGFRRLGVRGYLGKFFPLGEFRRGIGNGILAVFVGILEFFLEFVKPITLSMRLFGNIFGGEVALGVVTGLTLAFIPVVMLSLESLLNFIQALIFSTLTLVFTMIAIEGHSSEEHSEPKSIEPVALAAEAA